MQDSGDTKCDDCGAWKQTKTATTFLHINHDEDGSVASVKCCPSTSKKRYYTLVRRHYTCKSSPDLSRHISILSDPSGQQKPCQFIQYRFSGMEHSVVVKPHGNSKKRKRPYKRTCPSTLKDLETELKQHPPKRAVFRVEQKRGSILSASCVGDLPRNSLQASRIRCKKKTNQEAGVSNPNDPLQALVVKFKEESRNPDQYVQSIHLVPDPTIVLFNDTQLNDMEQFCASSDKASVLGIDVTFNLGRFYVTLCTYQNFKVVNERGRHPIMVGPALIHSSKDQSNFDILFQEITNRKPALATSLRAYGTDGEQALSNAAAPAFPFATHLRCANHLRDNITTHLRKQLLPEAVIKEVLSDTFGTASEKGLIHASEKEFDDKMKLLQRRWDLLEKQHKATGAAVVFKWFRLHVAPIIRENMRCELLRDLGLEEEKYTQNNSESLNALVKRYVNFQKQDVFQFVNDLEECVREQQNEVNKATIGLGRWTLSPSCSHVSQNTSDWFRSMSHVDKQNAISALQTSSAISSNSSTCNSGSSTSCPSSESSLSMPYTILTEILSDGQLEAMWTKASRLLTEKKVIKPPDPNPKTRWVVSDTASSPHVVTTMKANQLRYVCDKQCISWKTHNMCAHCIAVAEDNNELKQFLLWFVSSKGKECNLTNAVYHGTYKHAGSKKPPRRKYGDVTHLPVDHKTDRFPLGDISNVQLQAIHNDHSYAKAQCHASQQSTDSSSLAGQVICPPGNATEHCVSGCTSNNTMKTGQNCITVDSVGAMQPLQLCSTAQSVGTVNIGTTTTQSLLPSLSATLTTPLASLLSSIVPHLNLQSNSQSFVIPSTPSNATPSAYQQKPPTVKSNQPFFVAMLTNQIKKCSGCGALFRELSGLQSDYILGHMERDWFPQNGQWQIGKLQNKYYHLRRSCVLQRCPLYSIPRDFCSMESKLDAPLPPSVQGIVFKEFGVKFNP